jgi:transcriptional regulator with XRE-family HTH domain
VDEELIGSRDGEVDRVREELRLLVRASDRSQRQIERANDFTQGYLSQVLQGAITLTVRHFYGILFALEITPEEFFARLSGNRAAVPGFDEIRERFARYDAAIDQLERDGLVEPVQPPRRR